MGRGRRPLIIFIAILGGFLVSVMAINIVVDPYNIFRLAQISWLNSKKPDLAKHSALEKAMGIIRVRPKTIFLGSSTVANGLRANSNFSSYEPIYNAGVNDGGIRDVWLYLQHAYTNNPSLKTVIIGLEWNFFTPMKSPDKISFPDSPVLGHRHMPLSVFFERTLTWKALVDSFAAIDATNNHAVSDLIQQLLILVPRGIRPAWADSTPELTPQGTHLWSDFVIRARTPSETRSLYFSAWATSWFPYWLDQCGRHCFFVDDSFDYVRNIVGFCRERGIDLNFFISPHDKIFWALTKKVGFWEFHLEWLNRLALITPFWDFSVLIDFSDTEDGLFEGDPWHYPSLVGDIMLNEILQPADNRRSSPYFVTASTVHSAISLRDRALAEFLASDEYMRQVIDNLSIPTGSGWLDVLPVPYQPIYREMEIVRFNSQFTALPPDNAPFDILKVLRREYRPMLSAGTLSELIERIPLPAPSQHSLLISTTDFSEWKKFSVSTTLTSDSTKSPATIVTENDQETWRNIQTTISADTSNLMTATVEAHKGDRRYFLIFMFAGPDRLRCSVDLDSGVATMQNMGAAIGRQCYVVALGDGWWKIQFEGTINPQGAPQDVRIAMSMTKEPFVESYRGNGRGHVLLSKFTLEQKR